MVRVKTSLKERGRQILGLGRRGSDGEMGMGTGKTPALWAGSRGHAGTVGIAAAGDAELTHEVADADREREIDEMLSVEAKVATGEDGASARSARLSSYTGPLPASEWICPVSATGPRPLPAPPPVAARSAATYSAPSELAGVPGNQPLTSFPVLSPVERPWVWSPVAESLHASVVAEEDELLAMPQVGDAAGMEGSVGPSGSVHLTDEEETEVLRRQDAHERLTNLEENIQSLYDRILRENARVNKDITNWCHDLLEDARVIVTYREMENLARAEWCVEQVRARLDRTDDSRKQVRARMLIIVWGVMWFILLVYLIFNLARLTDSFINPEIFLRTLFFGGIGGVAAMLYHLFKHVSDGSFDSEHVLPYFGKPFIGMILGSMIYLTGFVAMRVVGLSPIGLAESNAETVTIVLYTGLLFSVAMAVGFKENLALKLLNRVIRGVLRDDDGVKAPATTGGTTR